MILLLSLFLSTFPFFCYVFLSQMDEEGYIPISVIAKFRRVSEYTQDPAVLIEIWSVVRNQWTVVGGGGGGVLLW